MAKKPNLICAICIATRDDPVFRAPNHLVHPRTGEHMLFDIHCIAICPDCGTRWRRWANKFEIVE